MLLLPGPVFSGERENSSTEDLMEALNSRNIPYEEGLIFSEAREDGTGTGGLSLLLRPGTSGAAPGPAKPSFILFVPLDGADPGPETGLPFRFNAALEVVNLYNQMVNENGAESAVRLFFVFLGYHDSKYLRSFAGFSDEKTRFPDFADIGGILEDPENIHVLYFDSEENPRSVRVFFQNSKGNTLGKAHGIAQRRAPLQMLRGIPSLAASLGIPLSIGKSLFATQGQESPELDFLLDQEIDALQILGEGREPGLGIKAETLGEFIFRYMQSLENTGINGDYNYSFIPLPGVFLPELNKTILALIAAAALGLGSMLILYRKRIRRKITRKHQVQAPRED
jgi:hypothetical protein